MLCVFVIVIVLLLLLELIISFLVVNGIELR